MLDYQNYAGLIKEAGFDKYIPRFKSDWGRSKPRNKSELNRYMRTLKGKWKWGKPSKKEITGRIKRSAESLKNPYRVSPLSENYTPQPEVHKAGLAATEHRSKRGYKRHPWNPRSISEKRSEGTKSAISKLKKINKGTFNFKKAKDFRDVPFRFTD